MVNEKRRGDMMFLLLVLIFVVSLPKAAGSMRRRQAEISITKLAAMDARTPPAVPETRISKEQARKLKAAAKAAEQAEKQRQKIEQAQADKEFLIKQIDRVVEILTALDTESARIDRKIQDDIDGRYYDAETRHRKQKETIARKIIAAENKLHALETKLAKVNYIIAGN